MFGTLRRVRFLFMAPFILVVLFVINWMTSPGDWWVQWAALGLGIAWVICLLKVVRDLILVGGLAALGAWLWRRHSRPPAPVAGTVPPPPPPAGPTTGA